ncbi:hypothetical protein ACPPVU_16255 [Mucilaginibacter sp. McL0603]|uniref:hypothetical protein n=1 Tax=Mucilaginibacter sp. McL0603 TaxID=3415670 RepID=UPI003CEFF1CF
MKTKLCLILIGLILLISCKKEMVKNAVKIQDSVVSNNDKDTSKSIFKIPDSITSNYNNSYSAWLSYKMKINNSYAYTINQIYVEPSNNVTVTTSVENGKVVARDYSAYYYLIDTVHNTAKRDTTAKWHEEGITLNTHPEAGDVMTLDDIYVKAKNSWLNADPLKNDIYFEIKNRGLISEVGYYPKGCQDNCFIGIQQISSITSL